MSWLARAGLGISLMLLTPPAGAQDSGRARAPFAAGLAALAQRDFRVAEEQFLAVIALDPTSHEAHNNLAIAYAEQGQEEEATDALRAALRLRPDYERARQNLAAVYVRLAAKELLSAAEAAPPPKRQALAAAARQLLSAGPHLAPGDLLARADSLARFPTTSSGSPAPTPTDTAPLTAATPAATRVRAGTTTPSAMPPTVALPVTGTPTPTESPTPRATTLTVVPLPSDTPAAVESRTLIATAGPTAASAAPPLRVVLEPTGAMLLVIDPVHQVAALYRRSEAALDLAGRWRIEVRGQLRGGSFLTVQRQSSWSARLVDTVAQRPAGWIIESAARATKAGEAVVLKAADFSAALSGFVAARDVVLVLPNAVRLEVDRALAEHLRERLERWRSAWMKREIDAYEALYTEGFVDEQGRPRVAWRARKEAVFQHSGEITIELRDVVLLAAGDVALARFTQDYRSLIEASQTAKQLLWQQIDGQWKIAAEEATAAPAE